MLWGCQRLPKNPRRQNQGAIVSRRRFQKGNIIIRGKTPRRYGMYREDVLQPNGTFKRVRRCVLLGPVSSMSERAAWKAFQPYLDRVNTAAKMPPKSSMTLETFVKERRTNVARAHSAETWQSHVDGDKHQDRAKLCGTSRNGWTVKENGGKRIAHSVFNSSQSKSMGLRLRQFHAGRNHHATRRREERTAVLH